MALFVMAQWSLPVQADNTAAAQELRAWAEAGQLGELLAAAQEIGGFPEDDQHWPYDLRAGVEDASYAAFAAALGEDAGATVYAAWNTFLWAHERAELALSPTDGSVPIYQIEQYGYMTAGSLSSGYPFVSSIEGGLTQRIHEFDSSVDVTELVQTLLVLAHAGELVMSIAGREPTLAEPFRWKEGDLVLVVAGAANDTHTEDVDFLIDLGGDDTYRNNAGGTSSTRSVALCVDLSGDDRYESFSVASQGAGLLGIGGLIDRNGDDVYIARDLSQGAAVYGAGFLWDAAGNDCYSGEEYCQGSASTGFALLWDGAGDDSYSAYGYAHALDDMGASFLIDMAGQDVFANTIPHRAEHPGLDTGD